MAMVLEAREASSLRLIGVDRKGLVVAAARMAHVIDTTAEGKMVPPVDDIEGQRRMCCDVGMKARRRLPSLEAHAGHRFAVPSRRGERYATVVAGHRMTGRI